MPLSVVILAAGQGKRMKSEWPKVLQPLAGRAFLKHVIDSARQLAPEAIHVVYGHGGERVREALKSESVSWVLQKRQLGTGHAVSQALPGILDTHTVLVLYGDVPLIRCDTLEKLLKLSDSKTLAILTIMLADPTGYGRILRDARGRIRKIVEHKDASKQELRVRESNTGIIAAPAKLLKKWLAEVKNNNAQGEFYLTDVAAIAAKAKFKVAPLLALTEAEVLGVNDKVQLAQVEASYREQQARDLMLAGVTLGDRARIGPNCVIRDCEIGADTQVFANCVLDHANMGSSCNIGPFARLRPGAALARGVHVGNYVEVKNTKLGAGSKANHLSYLGDAVIGKDVNVGAGTITCNYDGVNKSQTHIEDGVFVGSGSMLVAPRRIGARATIGAGSTITQDVPADKP